MSADDITIVFADDHPIFLTGLRDILEKEGDFRIVAECHEGETELESIRCLKPALAILDSGMSKLSGLDVASVIQRDGIPTAVIILTILDRVELFNRAFNFASPAIFSLWRRIHCSAKLLRTTARV